MVLPGIVPPERMERPKRKSATIQRRNEDFEYDLLTTKPKSSAKKKKHHFEKRSNTSDRDKGFQCSICGDYLQTIQLHDQHVHAHTMYAFHCSSCPMSFPEENLLQEHEESHYETEDVYECPECLVLFANKPLLIKHKRQIHGAKFKSDHRFTCHECGREFLQSSGLRAHISIHTGEKPFKCKECGQAFRLNSSLQRHLNKQHIGIKPYKCSECTKDFGHRSDLMHHMRSVHATERQFVCQICSEAFTTNVVLMRHINIHFQLKLNTCKICGAKFSHSGSLYNHMKVHSNERAFQCTNCGKSYKLKSHLKNHHCVGRSSDEDSTENKWQRDHNVLSSSATTWEPGSSDISEVNWVQSNSQTVLNMEDNCDIK